MLVSGQVQGVFYRAYCTQRARELGVAGWVRNLADGRVEAAFEGDDAPVEAMVAWCRAGTPWSDVESVEVSEETPLGEREFRVTR